MTAKARTRAAKTAPVGVRERILAAALATLREHGWQKLTQVRVAKRARVRQSHLTYYFPTRDDLLEAVTAQVVEEIGRHAAGLTATQGDPGAMLTRLASTVADSAHMRMFVGLIVEADDDPAIRTLMARGTQHIEAAIARALGGDDSAERARVILAATWGLGLYRFLMRPPAKEDPTPSFLSWLAGTAQPPGDRKGGLSRHTL
ncbi:MAG TPA: TetR/AcrR family transcriptional regulator [Gemmatimonadaceae bacterium]|nr:TetR/AcrR family transcriptional regulator [Gemmatimonadaceae bacterium]